MKTPENMPDNNVGRKTLKKSFELGTGGQPMLKILLAILYLSAVALFTCLGYYVVDLNLDAGFTAVVLLFLLFAIVAVSVLTFIGWGD